MNMEHALIELAHEARDAAQLRERALALLCASFEAEVGIFVAREGTREVHAIQGLPDGSRAALAASWITIQQDVRPVKERALRRGVATDRGVLGARLERTQLYRHVMAPVGGTETLLVLPRQGERVLGMVALGRRGGRFSSAALAEAERLVPALSVACRAVASPAPALPALTPTDLDLLDYLELGWGTRAIAAARGTSFYTVRNQLSALYRRLDVSNRAEAIGLRRGGERTP